MGNRIITGRILGDGRDDGAFGKIQIPYVFSEITAGCSLNPQRILAQIDGVHIIFQDIVLAHLLFEHDGQVLFLDFPLQFVSEAPFALACPRGQHIVLDELLGDGAGALGKVPACQADVGRAQDTS